MTPETCPDCNGDAGNNWFDRSFCPCEPGLGVMHTRCAACGWALDGCNFEAGEDDHGVSRERSNPK